MLCAHQHKFIIIILCSFLLNKIGIKRVTNKIHILSFIFIYVVTFNGAPFSHMDRSYYYSMSFHLNPKDLRISC